MNAHRIIEARLLGALNHAEPPELWKRLAARPPEQRPLALALLRLAELGSLAEIKKEVATIVDRLEALGKKEGKDSAQQAAATFWSPLLGEIDRHLGLAGARLDLESEALWEGIEAVRKSALRKGLKPLFEPDVAAVDPAFLTERLRFWLRRKAGSWLEDERRDRAAPKGDR